MNNEIRSVCFDADLNIEAYSFKGIMQKFPNHFHEYYVIGFIENGKRFLYCKNEDYIIETGDLILLNPNDTHTCEQVDNRALDYRCINIKADVMKKITYEITQKDYLPSFTQKVIFRSELVPSLKELHLMIMEEQTDFKKEELFFFLIEQLIESYASQESSIIIKEPSTEVKTICEYLENNYAKNITLKELSMLTGISKYHLLRSFTKQKGISPYIYLETIRIGKAKQLLENGYCPLEVALQTGFTDQSHFSNFFKKFIGLTPKQYMKIFMTNSK